MCILTLLFEIFKAMVFAGSGDGSAVNCLPEQSTIIVNVASGLIKSHLYASQEQFSSVQFFFN